LSSVSILMRSILFAFIIDVVIDGNRATGTRFAKVCSRAKSGRVQGFPELEHLSAMINRNSGRINKQCTLNGPE